MAEQAGLHNVTSADGLLEMEGGISPEKIAVGSTPEESAICASGSSPSSTNALRTEPEESVTITATNMGKGLTGKSQRFTGGEPVAVDPLEWSHKFAGGLRADIRRRAPYYLSDWTDGITKNNIGKTLSSTLFLFFACLAPALTFGLLVGEALTFWHARLVALMHLSPASRARARSSKTTPKSSSALSR